MGEVTIPQYFNLPYGLVVFAVVLMAIAGFAGASWVEKRVQTADSRQQTADSGTSDARV
jgi:hypothetical protein